jgi:hypothetical protein
VTLGNTSTNTNANLDGASTITVMHALKEWAIVVRAVEEGKQLILFRKGGILDDGFSVESDQFLLYPTFEHQSREYVKDEYKDEFDRLVRDSDRSVVTVRSLARVYAYYESSSIERLLRLSRFHILNDAFINYRMQWNRERPVSIMLIQPYLLDEPLIIPDKHKYYGCKSWIRLEMNTPIGNYSPIVRDSSLESIRKEVESILEV